MDAVNLFVVEDDSDLRELIEMSLGESHRVHAFTCGEHALEALGCPASGAPDVLLCDLGLPGMPGEDVVQALAGLPIRPRVVLMSGDPQRLAQARWLAHEVIRKPFSIRDLSAILVAGREA
jgi:CheY-like chemotaxis protein